MSLLHNKLTWWIRQSAWRFGLDICRTPNIKAMLAECDYVIDAGANDGDSYAYFRSLGYRGDVYSFEPTPEVFKVLAAKKGYRWHRLQYCLSDKAERVLFSLRGGDGKWNGISPMTNRACSEEIIHMITRRLDSWQWRGTGFLKIDCEGHDISVLRGASGIAGIRYVLMEVPVTQRFKSDQSFIESLLEIKALGYEMITVLGNIHSEDARVSQALDLLFIKTNK